MKARFFCSGSSHAGSGHAGSGHADARAWILAFLLGFSLSACTQIALPQIPGSPTPQPPIPPNPPITPNPPIPPNPPIIPIPPDPPPVVLEPRPAGSPDVAVFAVSGRCSAPCNAPLDNWNYLGAKLVGGQPYWGTVAQIQTAFEALGKTVQSYGYSSYLGTHTSNAPENYLKPSSEEGFLQLETKLKQVYADWIRDRSNPTQVVLVGHSHGVNWTHQFVRAHPEIPIAYLIDFDGISSAWESDNKSFIESYYAQQGKNPWPIALEKAVQVIPVQGASDLFDSKDVVSDNVKYNLELRSWTNPASCGFFGFLLSDTITNRRVNNTQSGIYHLDSSSECHSQIAFGSGQGVAWVKAKIAELRLP